MTFDEIAGAPNRLQQALEATASCHRTLILTAKELPAHAGNIFPTTKAAQDWLARTRKNPRTVIDVLHNGVRGFDLTAARIMRNQLRAQGARQYRPTVDLAPEEILGRSGK